MGGKFYIVTDGAPQNFWSTLDSAIVAMGFNSIRNKFHLPTWLMMMIGIMLDCIGALLGRKFKVSVFTVLMLTIHRDFSIANAREDLGYEPIVSFEKGWGETLHWMRNNWLVEWKDKFDN